MKKEGVVGSFLVCGENSSVLVRWRKITPGSITANEEYYVCIPVCKQSIRVLVHVLKMGFLFS
jgi:hypothetical protein